MNELINEGVGKTEYEVHVMPAEDWEGENDVKIGDMFDGSDDDEVELHRRLYRDGVPKEFWLDDSDVDAINEALHETGINTGTRPTTKLRLAKVRFRFQIGGMVYVDQQAVPGSYRVHSEFQDYIGPAAHWVSDTISDVLESRRGKGRFTVDVFPTGRWVSNKYLSGF
jgi:hypothetical protein